MQYTHCKNKSVVLNQLGLSQLQLHYQTKQFYCRKPIANWKLLSQTLQKEVLIGIWYQGLVRTKPCPTSRGVSMASFLHLDFSVTVEKKIYFPRDVSMRP